MHLPFIAHTRARKIYVTITCTRLKRVFHFVSCQIVLISVQDDGKLAMAVKVLRRMNCHATTDPPKIGPPGPFMAATAGPPGPFAALQMVPQTNYGSVVGAPLPHLVPRIIQRLLLLLNHSNVKN